MGFVEKIYAKIRASRDTFDVSLSYLPHLIGKTSPIFIKTDEDIEIFFEERNERICKIPSNVIIIPKGGIVNEDNDDDNNDVEDGMRFHYTWFDIDYLETDQIDVGNS